MLVFISSKQFVIITALIFTSIFACLVGFSNGSFKIEFSKIVFNNLSLLEKEVLLNIRAPRVALAVFVGAALGVAGATLQGLFRNPLADPGLIGVSAGGALGAVLSIVLLQTFSNDNNMGIFLIPSSAIFGSLTVIGIIYIITSGFNKSGIMYMLLVGIALNAIATVGIGFLTFISSDSQLRNITFWMMGSYGSANWILLLPTIFVISASTIVLISISRKLDIMQLGEIEAYRVGVDIKKTKMIIIISTAIMIGASVSLSGIVGFIGLVVPHLVRLLGGANHRYLLLGSALMGVIISVNADLFSRIVIQPAEIPIGLATSALGAPFFLWLVLRLRER
tara:strand:- start:1518 stop:2528 length:1011 start_codon:yes stop_codon:yes gene_type:complete